jgi:hypothetical protein
MAAGMVILRADSNIYQTKERPFPMTKWDA